MLDDAIKVKWKELDVKIRVWLDKRNNDHPMLNNSQRDEFVGILQKRYGYSKEKALSEFNEHYSNIIFR